MWFDARARWGRVGVGVVAGAVTALLATLRPLFNSQTAANSADDAAAVISVPLASPGSVFCPRACRAHASYGSADYRGRAAASGRTG